MKIALAILLVSTLPCFARLGETEEQSIARYGKSVYAQDLKVEGARRLNSFISGIYVQADFYKGTCCQITFEKMERVDSAFKAQGSFTDEESQLLFAQNSETHSWSEDQSDIPGEKHWKRDDGGWAYSTGDILNLCSPLEAEYVEKDTKVRAAESAAAAKQSVGGL